MEEFINYAHRGASEYYPENTFLAFYAGLAMGANGIETDVQMSRDRIPVLFHDRTLERMTGKPGSIGEYTYDELMAIEASKGRYRDKITGLEDFLRHFSFQSLRFAIELKGVDAEEAVAENICRYKIEKKTVVTSFELEYLKKFREILPQVQIGFLAREITPELMVELQRLGAEELCPRAGSFTKEAVQRWHGMGLRVRAWGVKAEELMRQSYEAGVDGMTVNFPDKLAKYLGHPASY